MKGIILAGGSGTRLHPLTLPISKQLLPVYDKPMIYYPLSTLMQSGIRDILIISTPRDLPAFRELLGNGNHLGVEFTYKEQPEPKGIPQAFLIGADFIGDDKVTLILGDNIFHGNSYFYTSSRSADDNIANVWTTRVNNPNRYGVVDVDDDGELLGIIEKPIYFVSNYAVTGLYQYPNDVIEVASGLKPSARGEIEISDINNHYIKEGRLMLNYLDKDSVWLDAGTHKSLHHASSYVETIQERSGAIVGSPEATAWNKRYISDEQLASLAIKYNNAYGDYLLQLPDNL